MLEFYNPYRLRLRIFLTLTAIFALCSLVAGVDLAFDPKFHDAAMGTAILAGIFAIPAAIFSAVMMWVTRVADRVADQFRKGEALADWQLAPAEWEAFLVSEKKDRGVRWGLARMRRNPRVVIGREGVYCGGDLTLWGMGGTVLQRVEVVSNTPMILGFAYGASAALRTVTSLATAGSAVAGGAARVAAGAGSNWVRVPVPSGREEEAIQAKTALCGS